MKYNAPRPVFITLVALSWLWTAPLSAQTQAQQEPPENTTPREKNFFANVYLGNAIDTFAPDNIGDYQNPDAGALKTRQTFGIFFDSRLAGSGDDGVQLWVYSETLHGVRSADIDCGVADDLKPSVCTKDTFETIDGVLTTVPAKTKYILEHASSLEAFINPRLEFLTLQKNSESPIRVYVTGRLGFIALERSPTVFKNYEIGAGFLLSDGPFLGSSLEVGWGRNELFADDGTMRLKLDGRLVFPLERLLRHEATKFFIEMRIDNDIRGDAADAIQTLYGFWWDLGTLFGN